MDLDNIGHGAINAAKLITDATKTLSTSDTIFGNAIICNALLKQVTSQMTYKQKQLLKKTIRNIIFDNI